MEIKLDSIKIRNFKGIKTLTIDLDGKSLDVRGTNATGKTTIMDAFTYLLFDKDSTGSSKFAIKTLDKEGKEINNLEHSVNAVFLIDGVKLELQKTYKENWAKKRGSVSKEFTGHSVDYSVDGVPVKEKEYRATIDGFILESDFKLLTMPDYFNSIKWQDRRALLLRLCGDIDMQDVIDSNSKLAGLRDFLGTHSTEEKRKIGASRQSAINKELSSMTARIDEHNRLISSGEEFPAIESLQDDCEALRKEIAEAMATDGNAGFIRQRTDLQRQLSEAQTSENSRASDIEIQIRKIRTDSEIQTGRMDALKAEAGDIRDSISRYQKSMERLRGEYSLVNKEMIRVKDNCPTCKQALPPSQVTRTIDAANIEKAERLEEINKQGKSFGEKVKEWQTRLDDIAKECEEKEEVILCNTAIIDDLNLSLHNQNDAQGIDLQKEVDDLTRQIEQPQAEEAGTKTLQVQLETLEKKIAKIKASDNSKARIKELKANEKELSAEYEALENGMYLIETFIVSKVDMLENKINSTFEKARFKLFETQINGGIKETCQTLYEGVPYDSGLNSGAKMMVGLDIIKVLQKKFDITAPIFIDNRESVVSLPEMDSQIISLIVDEAYETLDMQIVN